MSNVLNVGDQIEIHCADGSKIVALIQNETDEGMLECSCLSQNDAYNYGDAIFVDRNEDKYKRLTSKLNLKQIQSEIQSFDDFMKTLDSSDLKDESEEESYESDFDDDGEDFEDLKEFTNRIYKKVKKQSNMDEHLKEDNERFNSIDDEADKIKNEVTELKKDDKNIKSIYRKVKSYHGDTPEEKMQNYIDENVGMGKWISSLHRFLEKLKQDKKPNWAGIPKKQFIEFVENKLKERGFSREEMKKISKKLLPERGTPNWHRLEIAKKTVKMNSGIKAMKKKSAWDLDSYIQDYERWCDDWGKNYTDKESMEEYTLDHVSPDMVAELWDWFDHMDDGLKDEFSKKSGLKQEIMSAFPNMTEEDFDRHETDLYVRSSPELVNWLKENYQYYDNIEPFKSQIDGTKWLDIPFADWQAKYPNSKFSKKSVKSWEFNKHKPQWSFNKESSEINRDEEALSKCAKVQKEIRKYSREGIHYGDKVRFKHNMKEDFFWDINNMITEFKINIISEMKIKNPELYSKCKVFLNAVIDSMEAVNTKIVLYEGENK